MGIAYLALIILGLLPLITLVTGFRIWSNEKSMERAEQVKKILRRVMLSSRHADEVKEAAILYGIDSNEAGIDTVDLLEHRELLIKYLGEKQYENINKHILNASCPRSNYSRIMFIRHKVNQLIDLANLTEVVHFHSIHVVKTGGDGDAEAAARSIQAGLYACGA